MPRVDAKPDNQDGDCRPLTCHATALAIDGIGVLLRGPPAIGKSDLALRCLYQELRDPHTGAATTVDLVADDRVLLTRAAGQVLANPVPAIEGLLEVRGVGLIALPVRGPVAITLLVDLVSAEAVPRLPEYRDTEILLGVEIAKLALDPQPPSAPIKLLIACRQTLARPK